MKLKFLFIIILLITSNGNSQDTLKEPPPYCMLRELENYSYLEHQNEYKKDPWDALKNIHLDKTGNSRLSIGGQFRPRFEHFTNRFWVENDNVNYYSQRLALYSNIVLGKQIRFYTEFYHGYKSGDKEFAQSDDLAVFQSFIDFSFPIDENQELITRIGRQELSLGSQRLAGIREGPNIRQSYDMLKIHWFYNKMNLQAFYGKEVISGFSVFDNKSNLFDGNAINPSLWGIYTQFKIEKDIGKNELYYLGFHAKQARFNDVVGTETRHSLGLRRYGKIGKNIRYNTEIIYQFGKIGNSDISAFSIATDGYYKLNRVTLKPELGLKLEFSTGDRSLNDGRIQTFNPMFVNPAHYSLSGTITPANLLSIHPSVSFELTEKWWVYTEWAYFKRNSENDALYKPTRFISVPALPNQSKEIGHQFGLTSRYEINRQLAIELDFSYFIAGEYLSENNLDNNILHFAPTINYRF